MAAPEATEETGDVGANAASAIERRQRTRKSYAISKLTLYYRYTDRRRIYANLGALLSLCISQPTLGTRRGQ
jgi:hypothetical protein